MRKIFRSISEMNFHCDAGFWLWSFCFFFNLKKPYPRWSEVVKWFQRDRNYKKESKENIVKGDKTRFNDGALLTLSFSLGDGGTKPWSRSGTGRGWGSRCSVTQLCLLMLITSYTHLLPLWIDFCYLLETDGVLPLGNKMKFLHKKN